MTFPLALRIPEWCRRASVSVNGKRIEANPRPRSYVILDRRWRNGDRVTLDLPMQVEVVTWKKQAGAVSVKRGPLWFSLDIGEKWTPSLEDPAFPQWPFFEAAATTPWNYALRFDPKQPADSFIVEKQSNYLAGPQPFTQKTAPIVLIAKARRAPTWTLVQNSPSPLPSSPIMTREPVETIRLVPMGCARLRITVFPFVRD